MRKSAQSAVNVPEKPRFKVAVKGYPIQAFVDEQRKAYLERPVEAHYRPTKQEDFDAGLQHGWFTAAQLERDYDMREVPAHFRRRKRVRTDLTSALFEGLVVEALDEHQARVEFMRLAKINDTLAGNWKVKKARPDTPLGPYGPKKMRGLLVNPDEPAEE